MTPQNHSKTYIPAFDGIRGIFCILIITYHWPYQTLKGHFGILWWILQLFFILSAYLLTSNLLKEKNRNNPFSSFKKFYRNRILRIFPLYYFYLMITSLLLYLFNDGVNEVTQNNILYLEQNAVFLYTYTYNFVEFIAPFRNSGYTPAPPFSHLWSLSLEEQFYLVLPFIVLLLSNKNLRRFTLILIISGAIIRWQLFDYISHINNDKSWLGLVVVRNTFFQLDTFAYGVALAIFDFRKIQHSALIFLGILGLWITILLTSANQIVSFGEAENILKAIKSHTFIANSFNVSVYFTLTNILCAAFLLSVIQKTFFAKLFEFKWMIKLGQVSYGMYVYQFIILYFSSTFFGQFHDNLSKIIGDKISEILFFFIYISILYFFSKFSYNYLESWFLKWKINSK